ncbi:MAG: hypothetical protein LWY06_09245 [Firmicutes bacterium]|nr:hypothetical protein [Bacillota bacterium]
MKKVIPGAILFVFLAVLCISAAFAAETAPHPVFKAYLDNFAKLYSDKDINGTMKIFEPGAKFRFANGKVSSIEQWGHLTRKRVAGYKTVNCTIAPGNVKQTGDTAVVDFVKTDKYTKIVNKSIYKGKVVSGWTIKVKKEKGGWKAYECMQYFETDRPDIPRKQLLKPPPAPVVPKIK